MSADERPPEMPTDNDLAEMLVTAIAMRYRISAADAVDWLAWFVDAADRESRKPENRL
jgi:hypothetical protein